MSPNPQRTGPSGRAPRRGLALALLAALPFLASAPATAQRGPFAPPGTEPKQMPERRFDLLHRRLDLALDWEAGSVSGTAVNRLTPLLPGTRWITLHAAELDIARVAVDGVEAAWRERPAERELAVDLGRPVEPGEEVEVLVEYTARPRAGLYFVGPDEGYPDKPRQIWSQGESEFNRHWFPSWDHPNDRATTEAAFTVERPFRVVSNGRLVAVEERPDGRRTYRWSADRPHVTYLVSVVAGELVEITDRAGDVPVAYYVPPGREAEARRSFGRTPAMLEFFAAAVDEPYPWDKYAQTTAVDFIWGGMENVSATTQTLSTLHDERAASDVSSDDLVAHELAHQWFGDLVTCRTWEHAWLNEGFATYFAGLWHEHAEGADAFAWEVDEWRRDYFLEDSTEYRRPIVTARYPRPMALFDAHLYPKGALVLHMVRDLTGDDGWWRGVAGYLDRHRDRTVVTADLQSALEEATGVPLGRLFAQYVHGAGHPELAVSWRWSAEPGLVRVDVEQTQELTAETGLFAYPLELGLLAEDGTLTIVEVPLERRAKQSLYAESPDRPRTVVIDPRGVFLAEVDVAKPTGEWLAQLGLADHLPARLEAVRALGGRGGRRAAEALGRTAAADRFWGVRAEAARALARHATPAALAAVEPAISDPDSRVRTAALEALGSFAAGAGEDEHRRLVGLLTRALESERSYYARAAAATALGRFGGEEAAAALLAALAQDSDEQVVRAAALASLARQREAKALEPARRLAAYGAPAQSRPAAMKALATLTRGTPREDEMFDLLSLWARTDRGAAARQGAYEALVELGDPHALAVLDEIAAAEIDPQQVGAAARAATELRRELGRDGELRRRVEDLERETERLRGALSEAAGKGDEP